MGLALAAIEIRMTGVSARLVALINATEARLAAALLALAVLVLVSTLLYMMLRFATRFAAGREVGNLGLLIAGLGLLGELYQFVTPLFV